MERICVCGGQVKEVIDVKFQNEEKDNTEGKNSPEKTEKDKKEM